MRVNDAVTGALLVVFALAEIAYTRTFPTLHGQAYGPALFPTLIGTGLCICGLVLIARGLVARRAASGQLWFEPAASLRSKATQVNLALLLLCLLAYILLSDRVGFILMSVVILTLLLIRLGSRLAFSIGLAVASTLLLYGLFSRVLLVPLPAGLLSPVIG